MCENFAKFGPVRKQLRSRSLIPTRTKPEEKTDSTQRLGFLREIKWIERNKIKSHWLDGGALFSSRKRRRRRLKLSQPASGCFGF